MTLTRRLFALKGPVSSETFPKLVFLEPAS